MKKSKSAINRIFKLMIALLFVAAIFMTEASSQETKEAYFGKQITALTKQIAAAPKNDQLYVERARAYHELGKFSEAIADTDKALQINPKNVAASELRARMTGAVFKNLELDSSNLPDKKKTNDVVVKNDSAKTSGTNKQIAADPKSSDDYLERGALNLKNKKIAEALADAEKALKIRPSNSYAMLLRSDIKTAKGDKAGADADFRQAVKLRGETSIVARIVSHSGQTLSGIVVMGKSLGEPFGYSSIEEAKKDSLEIGTKVILKDKSTGKFLVFQGIVALDSKENVLRAETEFRPNLRKEAGILDGYEYLKIATDQSLFLPKVDRVTAMLDDIYVVDILDYSNLSLVRRQTLPLPTGSKAFDSLMDSEIATSHYDEAKKIYLHLEKISAKFADQNEVKATRKTNLKKLYKGSAELKKFVEQEMEKYNYTEEEKRSVRYQPFYV